MLIVGLVVNNIQRQFPIYWWTPLDLRQAKIEDEETVPDARGGIERKESEREQRYEQVGDTIEVSGARVVLPGDMDLTREEVGVLHGLRERLRKRVDVERQGKQVDMTESESRRSSTGATMVSSSAS